MINDFVSLLKEGKIEGERAIKILDRLNYLASVHARNEDRYSVSLMENLSTLGTITSYLTLTPTKELDAEKVKEMERQKELILEEMLSRESERIKSNQQYEEYLHDSKLIRVNGDLKYAEGKVLLVDDEVLIRRLMPELNVRKNGLLMDTAKNGSEGLEKALMGNYPVIVSDYDMPEMNGIEMAREIYKKVKEGEMLRPNIIFMSGRGADEINGLLKNFKAYAVLSKPFKKSADLPDLIQKAYEDIMSTQAK